MVMREMVQRERRERVLVVELFARLLGEGLGVQPAIVTQLVKTYAETVTHEAYHPTAVAAKLRAARKQVTQVVQDKSLLDRVAAMTVPEDQLPSVKKRGRKRR
jgi:hypothetical protein